MSGCVCQGVCVWVGEGGSVLVFGAGAGSGSGSASGCPVALSERA